MLENSVKKPTFHVSVCQASFNSALGVWWLTAGWMLQFDFIQAQLQGQQEDFVGFLWHRPCPALLFSGHRLGCGHPTAGAAPCWHPSLSSHYLYLLSSEHLQTQSLDGHSVWQRSTARNRAHKQMKPKIKIRFLFLHWRPEWERERAMTFFTFGLLFIEVVVNLLLQQKDWLPFEVAMNLEARETAK